MKDLNEQVYTFLSKLDGKPQNNYAQFIDD